MAENVRSTLMPFKHTVHLVPLFLLTNSKGAHTVISAANLKTPPWIDQ